MSRAKDLAACTLIRRGQERNITLATDLLLNPRRKEWVLQ